MDKSNRLSQLISSLDEAKREAAHLSEQLAAVSRRVRNLEETQIPDLMEEMDIVEQRTASGEWVRVVDKVSARKITEKHPEALQWLRDNREGGAIKTKLVIPCDGDGDDLLEKLEELRIFAVKSEEVHHSTMAALIKRHIADGEDVPMKVLGGYQRRIAQVSKK